MNKKHLRTLALLLAAFALSSMLLMACSRPGTASTGNGSGNASTPSAPGGNGSCPAGDTVKTGTSSFEQPCITLTKGGTLKLVQDQTSYHIFDYGQWNGTTAAPQAAPAGAPALKDVALSGPSVNVGPFTTAGTYHIYCTVHPGMDLTVVVK